MNIQQNGKGIIDRACRFWRQHTAGRTEDENLSAVIERVIDIADPTIRRAGRYSKILRAPVTQAMDYCSSIIDQVPGPVRLSRDSYFDDPTVKALFVSSDQLDSILHVSPEVDALRKSGYTGEAVALLTMTKEEKTIFGHQKQGEMIMRDVAQRAVNFVDHRVVGPAADLAAAKVGVVDRGLEVLATVAMERITNLRTKTAELREKREYLKGAIRIFGGKTRVQARFTFPDPAMTEQLRKAEETLASVEKELEAVLKSLSYPEDALRYLEGVMEKPADSLTVQRQSLNLNWMNVRVETASDDTGHEIALAEFSLTEELRRYGLFVTFLVGNGG